MFNKQNGKMVKLNSEVKTIINCAACPEKLVICLMSK